MKYVLGLLFCALLFRLGFFYFFPLQLQPGQNVNFQAVLLEDPKILGNSQEFHLRFGDFWHSTNLLIQTKADTDYSYGQTFRVIGIVKSKLLKSGQPILAIQNPQIMAKNDVLLPIFGLLRGKIIAFCENNFSQPYSGLLVGIIFGAKTAASAQTTASFRITGLSHLLVVDGLKTTLIAAFLLEIFALVFKRKMALLLSSLAICVYVVLSGFEISAIRAGIMAIAVFGAQLFGRQYSGLYVLTLVSGAMPMWDPLLLGSVAFQLSVLATGGILLLKPLLSFGNILSDDISLTLAAQLATFPVLLGAFGSISLISIPIHLFVMWTIPLIMAVGGLGIVVGLVLEPIGKIITLSILPLLWYLDKTAQFFSTHAFQLQISSLPVLAIVGYYLILLALVFWRKSASMQITGKGGE